MCKLVHAGGCPSSCLGIAMYAGDEHRATHHLRLEHHPSVAAAPLPRSTLLRTWVSIRWTATLQPSTLRRCSAAAPAKVLQAPGQGAGGISGAAPRAWPPRAWAPATTAAACAQRPSGIARPVTNLRLPGPSAGHRAAAPLLLLLLHVQVGARGPRTYQAKRTRIACKPMQHAAPLAVGSGCPA